MGVPATFSLISPSHLPLRVNLQNEREIWTLGRHYYINIFQTVTYILLFSQTFVAVLSSSL